MAMPNGKSLAIAATTQSTVVTVGVQACSRAASRASRRTNHGEATQALWMRGSRPAHPRRDRDYAAPQTRRLTSKTTRDEKSLTPKLNRLGEN